MWTWNDALRTGLANTLTVIWHARLPNNVKTEKNRRGSCVFVKSHFTRIYLAEASPLTELHSSAFELKIATASLIHKAASIKLLLHLASVAWLHFAVSALAVGRTHLTYCGETSIVVCISINVIGQLQLASSHRSWGSHYIWKVKIKFVFFLPRLIKNPLLHNRERWLVSICTQIRRMGQRR